jgi:hypothetical protein
MNKLNADPHRQTENYNYTSWTERRCPVLAKNVEEVEKSEIYKLGENVMQSPGKWKSVS